MKKIALLFLFFCIFVSVSYSNAEDLDSIKPSQDLIELVKKYNEPGYIYKPQKIVSSDDISQGIDSTVFFSSPDSPIKIRKIFNPGNKTNYLLGDPIGVYVEISSTDEDLSDIIILEVIDDDLSVLSISDEYGKVSSIDAICDYYRELNGDDFLESESCINEGTSCRMDLLNKSGISLEKDELEYKLLSFNLSENFNGSELNTTLKTIREVFKILWANRGYVGYNKNNSTNSVKINKINDLDFVDISFNDSTKTALMNISNQRFYKFKTKLNDKLITLNDIEVALKFKFNNLGRTDLFAYKYYIKPKKSGNFNTITLVRSYGRSDIKYISTIDIKEPNPQFEITPRPKDLIITRSIGPLEYQALDLAYDITYLGGASEPELNNVKIKLENDENYYICSFENNTENAKTMNFTKYKTVHVKTNVKFENSGKIPVPGIYINDKLYNFKDVTIEVYGVSERIASIITNYNFILTVVMGFIGFIILIITGKTLKQWITCIWSKISKKYMKENIEKIEKEEPDL